MNDRKEKKKVVITGNKMLRIIGIFAILSGVIFAIVELVRGSPFLEIFTENPIIWTSLAISVFVIFFLFGDKDANSKNEERK